MTDGLELNEAQQDTCTARCSKEADYRTKSKMADGPQILYFIVYKGTVIFK